MCSINKLTKTCKKCGHTKPVSEFNKHHSNLDGREGQCRTCRNARALVRYHAVHKHSPNHKPVKMQPRPVNNWKMGDPWFIF